MLYKKRKYYITRYWKNFCPNSKNFMDYSPNNCHLIAIIFIKFFFCQIVAIAGDKSPEY